MNGEHTMMRSLAFAAFYLLMGVNLLVSVIATHVPAARLTCMYIFLAVIGIQAVLISYCLVSWLIEQCQRCQRWFGGRSRGRQAEVGRAE